MQPITVIIVFPYSAMPNPTFDGTGGVAGRAAVSACAGPPVVEAGTRAAPSGAVPPFAGAPDFPPAEFEFPLDKIFETMVSHAGVGAAAGVVPVVLPAVVEAGFAAAAAGVVLPPPNMFETAVSHEGFAGALGVVPATGLAGAAGVPGLAARMTLDVGAVAPAFAAAAC
jgi:hypothetical protein